MGHTTHAGGTLLAKALDGNVTDFNVTATLGDACCDRATSLETEFLIRGPPTGAPLQNCPSHSERLTLGLVSLGITSAKVFQGYDFALAVLPCGSCITNLDYLSPVPRSSCFLLQRTPPVSFHQILSLPVQSVLATSPPVTHVPSFIHLTNPACSPHSQ